MLSALQPWPTRRVFSSVSVATWASPPSGVTPTLITIGWQSGSCSPTASRETSASARSPSESAPAGAPNALGGLVGQVSARAMRHGGPQALEGYTYMAHRTGTTRLAIGLVGNVELAGAGNATRHHRHRQDSLLQRLDAATRWRIGATHRPARRRAAAVLAPKRRSWPTQPNVVGACFHMKVPAGLSDPDRSNKSKGQGKSHPATTFATRGRAAP